MKPHTSRLAVVVATTGALLGVAPSAHALSTWNFGTSASPVCTNSSLNALGNTWTCNSGVPTLTATSSSTTGAGSIYEAANLRQYGTSGFGVRNKNESTASPDHSLDNSGARDVIALNFGQSVTLSQLRLGWTQNDSDISVLAYTGSGSSSIAGRTASSLLGSGGWSLIGNYANVGASSPLSINGGGISSSWWLVSAYNSNFGGGFVANRYDYVKLLAVAGTVAPPPGTGVPEPGSLALAALALGGVWGVRRRKLQD